MVRSLKNYTNLPYNPRLRERAKELRKAGNIAEIIFWKNVKAGKIYNQDFDRQKIIGNYIVDFYCANLNLVVEIDGSSHDSKSEYDEERDAYLTGLGLQVIHFSDKDVLQTTNKIIEYLKQTVKELL